MNKPFQSVLREQTRRHFFRDCGVGLGKIALAYLLANEFRGAVNAGETIGLGQAEPHPLVAKAPHYPAKIKNVIYLFMAGAPSQLDLFDFKEALAKHDGEPVPAEIVKDQRYAFIQRHAKILAPRFKFAKHGQSGAELSEMLPHLATIADEIAIVKSCHTSQFNHGPAQLFMNTGSSLPGRPAMGSWVTYGLGSQCEDLPGFVVLKSGGAVSGGAALWSSGFLSTIHQGVPFRSQGDPILFATRPDGIDARLQRETVDLVHQLNKKQLDTVGDPEIATRIRSYEMAYQMQTSAPQLMDLSDETPATLEAYGVKPGQASFANNCLLARRMVERGVRFIQLYHGSWDHHSDVAGGLRGACGETDQPAVALIKDLKQRGLLEETLIVWGGEFGRTPMVESNSALGRSLGRDHHPQAFTMWFCGGGIKSGMTLGKTDELGFHVTENPVFVHDIQATILHLLGLDHERLTFSFQGRQFRLTDVHGALIEPILG